MAAKKNKRKDGKKKADDGKRRRKAAKKARQKDAAAPPIAPASRTIGIEVTGVAGFPEPDQQGRPVEWWTQAWGGGGFEITPGSSVVTVPAGCGGRYRVAVAVRWVRINGSPFTLEQAKKGYLRCLVVVGDDDHAVVNALQSTQPPARGAHGSTQHMTWEVDLEEGARVGLRVAQSIGSELQADAFLLLRRI